MSEPVFIGVDELKYKVHPDGDVFRVIPGMASSPPKIGNISAWECQEELIEKVRNLPNRC